MILFGVFGLYLIFSGPKNYKSNAVYKIDHQVHHQTYRTEYKTGAELQSEEPWRFTGQAVFGVICIGLAVLFAYGLKPDKPAPERSTKA
jgi:hypothetical protein